MIVSLLAKLVLRLSGFVFYTDRNGEQRARNPYSHGIPCPAWKGGMCDCGFKED